ncbi:hypothetical protein [Arsenophonus nasoniae]|uniref:Prophage protein n=1 Tax=Arsenophonus nasoniae TaxID=638 RepID=A0AA95K8Q2_9GAMM|nr:hypothetical protein [Arsenophonus nasoniae]WGM00621.1 hypothetical protein QE210_12220 [Arsenophonus nasoniae]
MTLINLNFRLNTRANAFAKAIYQDVREENGGDCFTLYTEDDAIHVDIIDGVKGIRKLVDTYALKPLKDEYKSWESVAVQILDLCVENGKLSGIGLDMWVDMMNDMADSAAAQEDKS